MIKIKNKIFRLLFFLKKKFLKGEFILPILLVITSISVDMYFFNSHTQKPPKGAKFLDVLNYPSYTGDGDTFVGWGLNWMNELSLMHFDFDKFKMRKDWYCVNNFRRPPLYPIFIGLTYKIFGLGNYRAIIFEQMILKALTVVLIFLIFSLLKWKFLYDIHYFFGFLSGIFYALWLPASAFVHYYPFHKETLTVFFVVLSVFLVLKAISDLKYKRWILAGFVTALLLLTRAPFILFPLFLVIGVIIYNYKNIKIYVCLLVFTGTMLIIVSPLTIYNYNKYHRFILISSGDIGNDQWVDYSSYVLGGGFATALKIAGEKKFAEVNKKAIELDTGQTNQINSNRYLFKEALKVYIKNPINFFKLKLSDYIQLWRSPVPYSPYFLPWLKELIGINKLAHIELTYLYFPFWISATLGLFCYLKRIRLYLILYSALLYVIIIHLFFHFEFRYSFPAWPFLFLNSGFLLNRIYIITKSTILKKFSLAKMLKRNTYLENKE